MFSDAVYTKPFVHRKLNRYNPNAPDRKTALVPRSPLPPLAFKMTKGGLVGVFIKRGRRGWLR